MAWFTKNNIVGFNFTIKSLVWFKTKEVKGGLDIMQVSSALPVDASDKHSSILG